MIQAIRHYENLPGGAHAALVVRGGDVILIYGKDAADHPSGEWRFDLANALLDELSENDGDYALDGPLDIVQISHALRRVS